MGLKPQVLPEQFLRRMSKADRAPMGKAGMTKPEVQAKIDRVSERVVHGQINGWLTTQNIFAVHSRMDRKTTTQTGVPDFMFCIRSKTPDLLFIGALLVVRPIALEVKVNGNILSEDQERVKSKMLANGWEYYTVYSLAEVVKIVKGEN